MFKSWSGLSANASIPTSSGHDEHIVQPFLMAFEVSVKWRMVCNILRFADFAAFDWYLKIIFINSIVESGHSKDMFT